MKKYLKHFYDYIIVKKSGLFDSSHYLLMNPDVRRADIDPLNHFLKHGWKEGRNPNKAFDVSFYLEQNPDVTYRGINPLVHYVRFGEKEGRKPNRYFMNLDTKREPGSEVKKDPQETEIFSEIIVSEPKPPSLSPSELAQHIKENLRSSQFVISLSHDNYLQVTVGGVQVSIANEQKKYNQENISYIQFFPHNSIDFLAEDNQPFNVGINLDGKYLGTSETESVISAFKLIESFELLDINIHHTMGFSLTFVTEILKLNQKRGNFWIHDYYTICPSYHLLRNGIEYCGAPDVNSNACLICKYGDMRKKQLAQFADLFRESEFNLFAPSEFAIAFWQSKFPVPVSNYQVRPPVLLNWLENSDDQYIKGPVRVGFVGLPLPKKGWNSWIKLVNQTNQIKKYEFFHFSSKAGSPGPYKRIHTEVTPEQPNLMIENLRKNKIDVAFLWSVVPETFSFTLHEALAAGCFIITNKLSGNIQDYLRKNSQYGLVLENEDELEDLFTSGTLVEHVRKFQINGRPQAELIRSGARRKN